jgi:hypothetical protein
MCQLAVAFRQLLSQAFDLASLPIVLTLQSPPFNQRRIGLLP